jgi:hypothetical protein
MRRNPNVLSRLTWIFWYGSGVAFILGDPPRLYSAILATWITFLAARLVSAVRPYRASLADRHEVYTRKDIWGDN